MNPFWGILLTAAFLACAVYSYWGKWLKGLGFTFVVFAFGILAITFPSIFISWGNFKLSSTIVPLVQITLLGMGMTLKFEDFKRVFKMPKAIFIGMALQFTIMPMVGFICARSFGLDTDLTVGLILVGSCPGGVTSNVIAYLAKANVPLSITMTACSTIASVVMTPLAMTLLAGTYIPINFLTMMGSILKMIIAPLIIGLLINRYFPKILKVAEKILPGIAMLSICFIIAITIAISRDDLLKIGLTLFAASALHNAIGYFFGYNLARIFGLNRRDCRTIALEVGIQNGGMATGLAFNVLNDAKAALASAVFGPWSAITSSALASWWRCSGNQKEISKD